MNTLIITVTFKGSDPLTPPTKSCYLFVFGIAEMMKTPKCIIAEAQPAQLIEKLERVFRIHRSSISEHSEILAQPK